MKICFFGTYEKGSLYNRLKTLFEENDIEITECHESVNNISEFIFSYLKLFFKHIRQKYDLMVIPWRGVISLPLAKLVTKGPIIYFPYVSIYDTMINDRKKYKKNSIQAHFFKFVDKYACKLADKVVLENFETINYFVKEYDLDPKKFHKFIWGANEKDFPPLPIKKSEKKFKVFFVGTFIPFHGVEIIVKAAQTLSKFNDIEFILCGDGQTKEENELLSKKYGLENIRFLGFVDFFELRQNLLESDVCLGIFGSYEQRTNSMTNKIFQMMASQRPLITRDTPVMKEAGLENLKNSILVKAGSPEELSEAIILLKNNLELRMSIAKSAYETFKKISSESWIDFYCNILKKSISKP